MQVFSLIDCIVKREKIFPVRKQHTENRVFIVPVGGWHTASYVSGYFVMVAFVFCHRFPPDSVRQSLNNTVLAGE